MCKKKLTIPKCSFYSSEYKKICFGVKIVNFMSILKLECSTSSGEKKIYTNLVLRYTLGSNLFDNLKYLAHKLAIKIFIFIQL